MPIYHFKKDATHGKTAGEAESASKFDVPQGRITDILLQVESGGETYLHVRLELNGAVMFPFDDADGERFAELRLQTTRLKENWMITEKQNVLEALVYNNHNSTEYEVSIWVTIQPSKN